MATNAKTFQNYSEFWPYYLQQHSRASTRCWHLVGLASGITTSVIALVAGGHLWGIVAGLGIAYIPAWYAHFFIERNRPATFSHPFWSLISDFRMAYWMLTGKL